MTTKPTTKEEWENYSPVDPDEAFQVLWDSHQKAMERIHELEEALRGYLRLPATEWPSYDRERLDVDRLASKLVGNPHVPKLRSHTKKAKGEWRVMLCTNCEGDLHHCLDPQDCECFFCEDRRRSKKKGMVE